MQHFTFFRVYIDGQIDCIRREGRNLNKLNIKGWNSGPSHEKTPSQRRRARRELGVSLAFLSPSLIGVLVFFVLPFFVVIYYAFVNNPVLHEFVGLDNFRSIINGPDFLPAFWHTLAFSMLVSAIASCCWVKVADFLVSKAYPGQAA